MMLLNNASAAFEQRYVGHAPADPPAQDQQQIDYAAMSAKKNAPRWIKHLKRIGKWPAPRCAPTTASA